MKSRLRQVVGAHRGLGPWVGQLYSALFMLAGFVYLLVVYAIVLPSGHEELVAFIQADSVRVPASFIAFALTWHAWLGAKSVIMDYLGKHTWIRVWKYFALVIYLGLCLTWLLGIMWASY